VRALVPLVARATLRDLPQLRALGCTAQRILATLAQGVEIPPELDWLAPDAPAASWALPERARPC
jgi:hypothetical protein